MDNNNLPPLEWHPELRKVSDLKIWDLNPKEIDRQSLDKLKERIQKRGFHDTVKTDLDGTLISGNQRKLALAELGIEKVYALVPNRSLTEDEKERIALESNIQDGVWVIGKIKNFKFENIKQSDWKHTIKDYWVKTLKVKDQDFNEKEELEKITDSITKPGDLIILVNHKILCADSTNPENLKRLFGDEKASMVYSDPVYNLRGGVNYSKGLGGTRNYGGKVNDNRTDEEYKDFLRKSMKTAMTVADKNCHWFYWCSQLYIWVVQTLYIELSIQNKAVCIWAKNSQNPVPSIAFNRSYEPVVHGSTGKPYLEKELKNMTEFLNREIKTGNASFDDLRDIWTVKRMNGKDMEHATSKPPQLHEKAILRCTKPDSIILDSFLGSGSSIIAGECLKRKVYGLELEPRYCDLCAKRFERLTGIKPEWIHSQ